MNVYIPPIIEKVYNVQGSTAAPGSGEYHRYRAMRRRERTIAAAMEKEYEERKKQKDFEDKKEIKKQIIESERLKRRKRRQIKEEKKKTKKKFLDAIAEKTNIFKKDIPLIDQIKDELGIEEYKKICIQEEADHFDYNNIAHDKNIKRIKRNSLEVLEDKKEYIDDDHKILDNQTLGLLFPKLPQKDFEFENYDDYEEHLQILEIIEKNEKILSNNKEEIIRDPIKYIEETENIIIHDDDDF